MIRRLALLLVLLLWAAPLSAAESGYAGSASCRSCHEKFHQLWSTSRHGLAMRPYEAGWAGQALKPQPREIAVGRYSYRADVARGVMTERGPDGAREYPMLHALGGKNVSYFLTPLERGRLQTLPLAFDVNSGQWFDTAKSGIRHLPDEGRGLTWRDPAFTFNTSCHGCHVSQLSTNYDPATDSYSSTWTEPGINCETCHGPSAEHNRVCQEAKDAGAPTPTDLKITGGRFFTTEQHDDTCNSCHAKMIPLSASYPPGAKFFDHFDLVTLESPDYHPDGRDLGENYTATSWRMSPCARSGRLGCLHCHTSSGRFRQKNAPDTACAPCHQDKVDNPSAHTHHPAAGPGSRCISCHMPKTWFARMARSDHSMLPPTPAATQRFGSPNACNGCHTNKGAAWADKMVRSWRSRDYQAPVLERAELVRRARNRNFDKLPEMLAYLGRPDREDVTAASLIRLLRACPDPAKWPALRERLSDPSPLVRAAAATALAGNRDQRSFQALAKAAADPVRLVRVRAAESLAGAPATALNPAELTAARAALDELEQSLNARPDDWSGRYNLGNLLFQRGDDAGALAAYGQAVALRPDAAPPRINAALILARRHDLSGAEASLRQALEADPASAAAHFNLGLLLAETKREAEAEKELRAALTNDQHMAEAAFNLGLMLEKKNPGESLKLLARAARLRPDDPRYGHALGYAQHQRGDGASAARTLAAVIRAHPDAAESYRLLAAIYEARGETKKLHDLCEDAQTAPGLNPLVKAMLHNKLEELKTRGKG